MPSGLSGLPPAAGGGHLPALMETSFLTLRTGARLRLASWRAASARSRGTVLLLTGRSEPVEKYEETAGDLLARGFAVHSLDWRGQGLSDRFLADRERCHVDDFAILVADLAEVVDRVVLPADGGRPLVMLGHSMGGMLGLRFLAEHPGHVRRAAFTAPMVGIQALRRARWLLAGLADLAVARGRAGDYALGQGDFDPDLRSFAGNRLTSDPARFEVHRRAFQTNPELRVGGVTWGWLAAACRSTRLLLTPAYARRITVPVLIASAGREALVDNAAQKRLAQFLPDCTFTTYPDALHEILMERDEIRDGFLSDFDRFLERHGI